MEPEMTLLGLVEAARRLDLSVNRLRYLADTGAIKATRDSAKRPLFCPQDVCAWPLFPCLSVPFQSP